MRESEVINGFYYYISDFTWRASSRPECSVRLYTCTDRELWEHCLSVHPARNHRRKMKQEAAGDVQLAVNDTSSRWGNNFPIHQSSSALLMHLFHSPVFHFLHCCLLWGGITWTGEGGLIELDHNLMFISAEMKLSRPR